MRCTIIADGRHYGEKTGTAIRGSEVEMRLYVPRETGAMEVHLNLRLDQEKSYFRSGMEWEGMEGEMDLYVCQFPAVTIGLYWYYFDIDGCGGTYFSSLDGRKAFFTDNFKQKKDLQLTIYQREYKEPAFLPGGLFYHVFVDRFYRGGEDADASLAEEKESAGLAGRSQEQGYSCQAGTVQGQGPDGGYGSLEQAGGNAGRATLAQEERKACKDEPAKSRYRFLPVGEGFDNATERTLIFHDNWDEVPAWQQDSHGEILNNDFFGGNLAGIREKLPYFKKLGVTCLYLSPIFEAYSNHKYDTGDYGKVDRLFGTREEFEKLCQEAGENGISVMLDGVFNHTGADSIYFNKYGIYPSKGAWQGEGSPYRDWYSFSPDGSKYRCWWGIDTLPTVNKDSSSFQEYLFGEEGIVRKWIRLGAAGWRLDVVDELPDGFLKKLVKAAKSQREDAVVLGEVWEDASNKAAYGVRREYFQGQELDSVMNYPWKDAIISYIRKRDAGKLADAVDEVCCNYPPEVLECLMNPLGTHDSVRALTALAWKQAKPHSREEMAGAFLSEKERHQGIRLLKMASLLQMILPGVPCIYYGDEAGMEGFSDPFNRGAYPWGREEKGLKNHYFLLAHLRKQRRHFFAKAGCQVLYAEDGVFLFARVLGEDALLCGTNRGKKDFSLTGKNGLSLFIPGRDGMLLQDLSRRELAEIQNILEDWMDE